MSRFIFPHLFNGQNKLCKSDNSGDETSDSGVQTPPPELSDQDDKPEKLEKSSELLTSLDKLRKAGGRTRTRSE